MNKNIILGMVGPDRPEHNHHVVLFFVWKSPGFRLNILRWVFDQRLCLDWLKLPRCHVDQNRIILSIEKGYALWYIQNIYFMLPEHTKIIIHHKCSIIWYGDVFDELGNPGSIQIITKISNHNQLDIMTTAFLSHTSEFISYDRYY